MKPPKNALILAALTLALPCSASANSSKAGSLSEPNTSSTAPAEKTPDASAKPGSTSATDSTSSSTNGKDAPAAAVPPAQPQQSTPAPEVSGVTLGLEERFRFEGYNNVDFNRAKPDRLNLIRMRTRPYADVNFNDYLEGYVRLGWEGLKRMDDPAYPLSPAGSEQASPYMAGEMWFSSAYIKVKKFPGLENLSLQVGRFDMVKGEGWLFNDPSGVDGSRDGYTNGFDLAYTAGKSKMEFIGIYDPRYDEFFPTLNPTPIVDPTNPANNGTIKGVVLSEAEVGKQLQEWDQTALGVYYTNRERRYTDVDSYAFFNRSYGDIRKPASYLYLPDRSFGLFGGRIVQRLKQIPGLSLTGEFAYEAGTESSMHSRSANFDMRAWAGFGYAKKSFRVKFSPYVTAGFWALSGQNPNSRTVGNFDAMFNRTFNTQLSGDAPSWSEFFAYSYGYEEGTFYWTNLKMAQVESGFSPDKRVTLVAGYAHLDSMEPFAVNPFHAAGSVAPAAAPAGVFASGLGRGQLAKVKAIYKISPHVSGYINLEKFFPGDFYVPQNSGYWFRADITYKFKGFLPFQHKESGQ